MTEVGVKLRARRPELGFSQEEVGRMIGVTPAAVAQWEAGTTNITLDNLLKAARALRIQAGTLVGDDLSSGPDICEKKLALALACLEQSLGGRFKDLPASQQAKLVAYLYRKGGQLPAQEVFALLALVA